MDNVSAFVFDFLHQIITWVKVFKTGQKKICGRQPLKHLKCITSNVLMAVFQSFYFVHSWIPWLTFTTINILFLLHRGLNKLFGDIFHTVIKYTKNYWGECKLEASLSSYYISCTLCLSIRQRKKENALKWRA